MEDMFGCSSKVENRYNPIYSYCSHIVARMIIMSKFGTFMDYIGCEKLVIYLKDCIIKGVESFFLGNLLGSAVLLVIIWSCCFLSMTSMPCLVYLHIIMGALRYSGDTLGIVSAGIYATFILWVYARFWISGVLFIFGGYVFPSSFALLVGLIANACAIGCVKAQVGWLGVFFSINFAFFLNDTLHYMLQCYDKPSENTHFDDTQNTSFVDDEIKNCEEPKETKLFSEDHLFLETQYSIPADENTSFDDDRNTSFVDNETNHFEEPKEPMFFTEYRLFEETQYCIPTDDLEKHFICMPPCKLRDEEQKGFHNKQAVREDTNSINEMKRILNSRDHYETMGFKRDMKIDATLLKKEYRKKVMLVHPDKNHGTSLASESFQKLQRAYEVLSASMKKIDYDDHPKKPKTESTSQSSYYPYYQDNTGEQSLRVHCKKCNKFHLCVMTQKRKATARWCEDCYHYHEAKDGDGWVEFEVPWEFFQPWEVEIPSVYVCVEGMIFEVLEWGMCQRLKVRANTHRPTFHLNKDMNAEMTHEEKEHIRWINESLASGHLYKSTKNGEHRSPYEIELVGVKYRKGAKVKYSQKLWERNHQNKHGVLRSTTKVS